jgi:cytochrome c6
MRVIVLLLAFVGAAALTPMARPMRNAVRMSATTDKIAAASAAAAILLAGATPAFAGDAANGGLVFSGNCAACHAGGNNVIQAEKTLKKDALVEYLAGGFKEESIVYQVTNGKNAMPAFGGRLSDEEIGDVAAYVYKTASADAWE